MDFDNLHQLIRNLYEEMLPLCEHMVAVGRAIAGLGALFYIAYRVWQSLAKAEPIEFFPLLRPIAIGLCIAMFPTLVLGGLNGIMSPIVKGTHQLLEEQTFQMETFRQQRDALETESLKRNPETAYLVDNEEFENKLQELNILNIGARAAMHVERSMYNAKKWIQEAIQNVLELLFQAASLILDVVRTFFLIVLAILGPIAFGISVWDGFQNTLVQWISRYIGIYLWLPVADLFGAILARLQILMIESDMDRLHDPDFIPDSSNAVYIIFMIIGLMGYFAVPTVASWIVESGGGGNYTRAMNTMGMKGAAAAGGFAGSALGNMVGKGMNKITSNRPNRNISDIIDNNRTK